MFPGYFEPEMIDGDLSFYITWRHYVIITFLATNEMISFEHNYKRYRVQSSWNVKRGVRNKVTWGHLRSPVAIYGKNYGFFKKKIIKKVKIINNLNSKIVIFSEFTLNIKDPKF